MADPSCLEVRFYCGPCFQCQKEIEEPGKAHVRLSPIYYGEPVQLSMWSTGPGFEFNHVKCCPECHQEKILPITREEAEPQGVENFRADTTSGGA